jgi:hypothetical protein
MDITYSTGTTYTSGDPARVTIDRDGMVTAVSGGQVGAIAIDVQYSNKHFSGYCYDYASSSSRELTDSVTY